MRARSHRFSILLILLLGCCVEPFDIESIGSEDAVVVEGFISTEMKQHRVLISRTSLINERKFIPETGASVQILVDNGKTYTLTEESPGIYLTPPLAGTVGSKYTLNFTTKNGKHYVSAEVTLKNTPPISKISAFYSPDYPEGEGTGGIRIFLDTQDPTNQSRYYRWEFKETYEIKTPYPSAFVWLGGNDVVFRDVPVDHCWGKDSSRNTLIKSTVGLEEDKVTAQPIQQIPGYSFVMRIKYSILIRQYALSKEAYLYWKAMKEINEGQGSLYDRQPGTLAGNITSASNPGEVVLGYFDAGAIAEKRVFFTPDNFIKDGYKAPKFLTSCDNFIPIEVKQSAIGAFMTKNGAGLEISEAVGAFDATLLLRPKYCCNCTNLGTNVKPSYWE